MSAKAFAKGSENALDVAKSIIIQLLAMVPGEAYSADEIADSIKKPLPVVTRALRSLSNEKRSVIKYMPKKGYAFIGNPSIAKVALVKLVSSEAKEDIDLGNQLGSLEPANENLALDLASSDRSDDPASEDVADKVGGLGFSNNCAIKYNYGEVISSIAREFSTVKFVEEKELLGKVNVPAEILDGAIKKMVELEAITIKELFDFDDRVLVRTNKTSEFENYNNAECWDFIDPSNVERIENKQLINKPVDEKVSEFSTGAANFNSKAPKIANGLKLTNTDSNVGRSKEKEFTGKKRGRPSGSGANKLSAIDLAQRAIISVLRDSSSLTLEEISVTILNNLDKFGIGRIGKKNIKTEVEKMAFAGVLTVNGLRYRIADEAQANPSFSILTSSFDYLGDTDVNSSEVSSDLFESEPESNLESDPELESESKLESDPEFNLEPKSESVFNQEVISKNTNAIDVNSGYVLPFSESDFLIAEKISKRSFELLGELRSSICSLDKNLPANFQKLVQLVSDLESEPLKLKKRIELAING